MNRGKREIFYSIGIIIAIPVLLIVNTIVLIQSTRRAFNNELMRKADVVNSVIAQTSLPLLKDKQYDILQKNIIALEQSNPSLLHSTVIVADGNTLKQVAQSTSASGELSARDSLEAKLAMERKLPIATLINTSDQKGKTAQAWNVMTPIIDESSNVIGAISVSMLTADAQEAIDAAYQTSFIILIVSILLIIGLLFRHFRLVGYAQLLARQKELNQTMSDFLSVATHELKAPTSIIKGYISNIMDGLFGPVDPKINEQLGVALAQTDRLNALVQDLLNVNRVDQGRIQYNYTAVDTTKILQNLMQNYQGPAAQKGLLLVFNSAANIPQVRADQGRVQEIFTNLIDNAIKYTPGGSVIIGQKVTKDYVITSFHDTGLGMSAEAKQRLFQRFYRVKTPQTQQIPGTGLGLWIIKQYITAMGGTIDVESIEGVGSNFIVSLPIQR